jgi:hypothetical protein
VTVLPAVHTPVWHVSFRSHSLPFVHDVPLLTGEYCVVLTLGLILPRFGGLVDYAAKAASWDLNSNSIGLT